MSEGFSVFLYFSVFSVFLSTLTFSAIPACQPLDPEDTPIACSLVLGSWGLESGLWHPASASVLGRSYVSFRSGSFSVFLLLLPNSTSYLWLVLGQSFFPFPQQSRRWLEFSAWQSSLLLPLEQRAFASVFPKKSMGFQVSKKNKKFFYPSPRSRWGLPSWLSGKEPMQKRWVWSRGQEDPLEEEMATHSSILAWEIPWTEQLGGLQSMGCKELDMT